MPVSRVRKNRGKGKGARALSKRRREQCRGVHPITDGPWSPDALPFALLAAATAGICVPQKGPKTS